MNSNSKTSPSKRRNRGLSLKLKLLKLMLRSINEYGWAGLQMSIYRSSQAQCKRWMACRFSSAFTVASDIKRLTKSNHPLEFNLPTSTLGIIVIPNPIPCYKFQSLFPSPSIVQQCESPNLDHLTP